MTESKAPAKKPVKKKPAKKRAAPKVIDWEAMELDYRAGVLSLAQIGLKYGCTKGRVSQKATELGWERDLAPKVQAKAKAELAKDDFFAKNPERSRERAPAEAEVVAASAQALANVIRGHRSDIGAMRELCSELLDQVKDQTGHRDLYRRLGELLAKPDENGVDKLNDIYFKVIALPQRIDGLKKLTETLKNLIGLERQAYGITDSGLEDLAKAAANAAPMSAQEAYTRMLALPI